jgi:hypothetical protein
VVERLMGRLCILPYHLLIRDDDARLRCSVRACLSDLRALTLPAGNKDRRGMPGFGSGGAASTATPVPAGTISSRSGSGASPARSSTLALTLCLALPLPLSLSFTLALSPATGGGAASAPLTWLRALASTRLSALSRSGCALAGFPLCG